MASFNGNSYCGIETKAERRERARNARAAVAALSPKRKVKLLARAIIDAAAKRGTVSLQDGVQAGLSITEVETYFPRAIEIARAIEPRLTGMAVQ